MHNKILFIFLTVVQIIFPISGYSKCLTDIYSVGASFDSLVYNIEESSSDYATLTSDQGYGIKLAWLQYCPESKLEMTEYLRVRSFELDTNDQIFHGMEDSTTLFSLGFEMRYFLNSKVELISEVEAREDMGLYYDPYTNSIYNDPYMNLKAVAGARYFLKSNKTEDFTAAAKVGLLLPISNSHKVDSGYVADLDFEYFKRLTSKYSIRTDLYYSYYSQNVDRVDFSRHDLGVRLNYVFRY